MWWCLCLGTFCSIQELSPPWQRTPSAAFEDVSTIWSASDTDFKNLSSNFHWWGLSPPFDQQVILTSKTYVWVSPHFDQGVSTFGCLFWSQCLHLLISKWHWLQKPKFQLSLVGVVSTFWPAHDTDFKHLSLGVPAFWSGCLHLFWSGCLHLLIRVSLTLFPPSFHQDVSAFWSTSDTDFKNLCLGVYTFWSASDTDFKILHLGVSIFWSGCFDFAFLHPFIRVSPPFDQQVTLTSKT